MNFPFHLISLSYAVLNRYNWVTLLLFATEEHNEIQRYPTKDSTACLIIIAYNYISNEA